MTGTTTSSTNTTAKNMMMIMPTSFFIGCIVALASQYILQDVFYNFTNYLLQHFMNEDTKVSIFKVTCFSLTWSFITCIIVFIGMVGSMYLLEALFIPSSTNKKDVKDDTDDDDANDAILFRMELAYVLGAIFAIMMLWTVFDFGLLQKHTLIIDLDITKMDYYTALLLQQSPAVIVLITMSLTLIIISSFALIVRTLCDLLFTKESDASVDSENITPTKKQFTPDTATTSPKEWLVYIIASTFGLLIGVGTQLLLSLILWNSIDHIPYVMKSNVNIALFSFGWSLVTVVVTAIACYLLRTFIFRCIFQGMSGLSYHYKNIILIRMEAMFIGWTLTGICVGWIVLDILHNMTSQIYVSIVLFVLSLTCFSCILYFFPESDEMYDETEGLLTEPLLSSDDEEGTETGIIVV